MSSMQPSRRQAFATAFASVCSLFAVRKSAAQSNAGHPTIDLPRENGNQIIEVPISPFAQVTQYEIRPSDDQWADRTVSYTVYDAQGRVIRSGEHKPLH